MAKIFTLILKKISFYVYIATRLLPPLKNEIVATICPKQSFSIYHFEIEGNGHLYGPTEQNHFIKTGP